MIMEDWDALLDLAVTTVGEVGTMLVERRPAGGPAVVLTKSSPTDVVTAMDQAAERRIVELIGSARPDDAFLGEEGGESGGGSGIRWVVDPIDGTVNYLYDLPDWAVSIAAEADGEAVAGVIAVPRRGELFTAVRGRGAWVRRADGTAERLRCNTGVPLDRALVATGFGYSRERRTHQADVLRGVLPRVRDIRRSGSCCIDLCAVAAGRVDGYFERGPQHWDIAAGSLIVAEAGGRVAGLNGNPAGPEFTLAAAPDLFERLHGLLVPLNPGQDAP